MSTPRKQRRCGRPTQITLAVVKEIGKHVARGMPERSACHLMTPPVSYESFRSAKRRNPQLGLVIGQAQAEFMAHALKVIQADGTGSAGYRWILERRHPEEFGQRAGRQSVSQ